MVIQSDNDFNYFIANGKFPEPPENHDMQTQSQLAVPATEVEHSVADSALAQQVSTNNSNNNNNQISTSNSSTKEEVQVQASPALSALAPIVIQAPRAPQTVAGPKQHKIFNKGIEAVMKFFKELSSTYLSLTSLNLRGNGLTDLPEELGSLIHLKDLNLSANEFSHLPQVIEKLKALEILNLKSNKLDPKQENILKLIEILIKLQNLTKLDLSDTE